MPQLALGKRESRLLWQVLARGIQATDDALKDSEAPDRDVYWKLRGRVLAAWKSGIIVGGVRPKRRIDEILPNSLLKETKLGLLKKADKRARTKAKRAITVPKQPLRARNGSGE